MIDLIERDSRYLHRQGKGDHRICKHPDEPGIIVIDGKLSNDMPKGTLGNVLRTAGLKRGKRS